MQCFILLHLFGHSVQWVAPSLAAKLGPLQNTTDREAFMKVLHDYEYEAARFGMQLLHEAGIHDFDQWYADFVVTDWQYLERYYREGTIPPWRECVATAQPLIQPEPIRHWSTNKWKSVSRSELRAPGRLDLRSNLLNENPHARSQPHGTLHLFQLYPQAMHGHFGALRREPTF